MGADRHGKVVLICQLGLCLTLAGCASLGKAVLEGVQTGNDESYCKNRCEDSEWAYHDVCYRKCMSEQALKRSSTKEVTPEEGGQEKNLKLGQAEFERKMRDKILKNR